MTISSRGESCGAVVAAGAAALGVPASGVAGAVDAPEDDFGVAALPLAPSALIACLHPDESDASCCCRQATASLPPGVTPEQLDRKSLRQADLIALRCASVGCCARAAPANKAMAASAGRPSLILHMPRFVDAISNDDDDEKFSIVPLPTEITVSTMSAS
jgi:hypothetical protein